MTTDLDALHVLVICTGNLNRSPVAAALLEQHLGARGVDARVDSAGFLGDDLPIPGHAVTVMDERGLDVAHHVSRRLSPELVRAAELVVTMERRHVREIAVLDRDAFDKTFTLVELVRRGAQVGPRPPGVSVPEWLARVGADRTTRELLEPDAADDVADPHRQDLETYRRTVVTLDELVRRLVDMLAPVR